MPTSDRTAPSGSSGVALVVSAAGGEDRAPPTSTTSRGDDVDDERRAPPERGEHPPAGEQEPDEQRAERTTGAGEPGPHGDRLAPLVGGNIDERRRQRGRHHERCADPGDRPRDDHHRATCRRARRSASRRPNTVRPPISASLRPNRSPIAPARQQQPGEHDRVRVDDPLEIGRPSRRGRAASTASPR